MRTPFCQDILSCSNCVQELPLFLFVTSSSSCDLSFAAFFLPQQHPHDPEVDSMVGKPRFAEPGEETSGESDTSTGLHTQSATNVESFAQFV